MNDDRQFVFNFTRGREEKDAGMLKAARRRATLLAYARDVAQEIARESPYRFCNADQVGERMVIQGVKENLGPAAGSLFRGEQWEFVEWKRSARITNHARLIGIWKLK
jgi:hypothetical protein